MSHHDTDHKPDAPDALAERLDALERIVMRQQEEINTLANSVTLLKLAQHDVHTRVGVIEGRDSDGK